MSSKKLLKSVLFNPIISWNVEEVHRSATPLGIFYDLISVIAIASVVAELHHALSAWHHVGQAIGMYGLIFFFIWGAPWDTHSIARSMAFLKIEMQTYLTPAFMAR
jgi:hypothetical protein